MKYSEIEFNRLNDSRYVDNFENQVELNLLNFIRYIHLNKQDFYIESYDSQYLGDIEMTFKKDSGSLIGYCRATIKKEDRVVDYLFTENGFERVDNIISKHIFRNPYVKDDKTVYSYNKIMKRNREDTQHITPEVKVKLNKVAYYLSKFEHNDLFEHDLNQGETIKKLADILSVKVNTLKNKRDQYDPYCSTWRVGWVQQAKLSDDMKEVYDDYKEKTKEEILEEIMKFIS